MKLTPVRAFAPALVVLALAVAGCSGGGEDGDSGGASSLSQADGDAPAEAPAADRADGVDGALSYRSILGSEANAVQEPVLLEPRALIKKGNVSLRSDDVGKSQFEAQQVVDEYGGQVTEEKTTTDDDGKPAYTRMVLRIPSGKFDEAMTELKKIAELESANTSEDDVTTKLIDTRTRITVQRRSIARITTLFERATSIRDIMAIEAQLSRRQADLDSLERQAAYLSNQTAFSTITLSVDQIPEQKAAPKKDEDEAGFVSGLSAGWGALTTFAVGLATVAGALLPWLVVVVVLGPPLLLLVRATRRRRTSPEPEATPAEG